MIALGGPPAHAPEAVAVADDAAHDVVRVVGARPVARLARLQLPVPLARADLLVEADAVAVLVEAARAGPADVAERRGGQEQRGREERELHCEAVPSEVRRLCGGDFRAGLLATKCVWAQGRWWIASACFMFRLRAIAAAPWIELRSDGRVRITLSAHRLLGFKLN